MSSIRKTILNVAPPHERGEEQTKAEAKRAEVPNRLLSLLQDSRILSFRQPSGEPWISLPRPNGGYEHHRVENHVVVGWLMEQYTHQYSAVPEKRLAENAVMTFAAKVRGSDDVRPVHDRLAVVGEPDDRTLYLDLGDTLHVVRIRAGKWEVVDAPQKVAFRRATGFEALPLPQRPASGETPGTLLQTLLRPLLNCPATPDGDFNFVRMVAWVIAAFYTEGDQAILALTGGPGAGKSSVAEVLRSLIDPNTTRHGNPVTNAEGVMFEAVRQYVPCFDNLRGISDAVSDALANVATGSGQAKRKLYTDDDIISAFAKRPIILNGLQNVVKRPDLVDRTFILNLPTLDESNRKFTKAQLRQAFRTRQPRILGAILEVVAAALQRLPAILTAHEASGRGHYRLGDFHMFVTAAEPALGWPAGTADRIMRQQTTEKQRASMEQYTDIEALVSLLYADMQIARNYRVRQADAGTRVVTGAVGEVLTTLSAYAHERLSFDLRSELVGWPKLPKKFAQHLREAQTALEAEGIRMRFETSRHKTIVTITGSPDDGSQERECPLPSHRAGQAMTGLGSEGSNGSEEMPPLKDQGEDNKTSQHGDGASHSSPDSPAPLNSSLKDGSQMGAAGAKEPGGSPTPLQSALSELQAKARKQGGKGA